MDKRLDFTSFDKLHKILHFLSFYRYDNPQAEGI